MSDGTFKTASGAILTDCSFLAEAVGSFERSFQGSEMKKGSKNPVLAERNRASATHGHCVNGKISPLYRTWSSILARCTCSTNSGFRRYGAKGITVCDRWKIFENFAADMGPRPSGKSIDRIDNSKGYSPDNCRWATEIKQARNRITNRLIIHNGETRCMAEWAELYGLKYKILKDRVAGGWDFNRALTEPIHEEFSR